MHACALDVDSAMIKAYGGAKLSHNGRHKPKAMDNTQQSTGDHSDRARRIYTCEDTRLTKVLDCCRRWW